MLDSVNAALLRAGVLPSARLQELGATRTQLGRWVAKGELLRPRRGVYASTAAPHDLIVAATHGGMLTCTSALRVHGLWVLSQDTRVHVWLGRSRHAQPHAACTCVAHRYRGRAGEGVVSVAKALAHVLACCGQEDFFVALESALRQGKLPAAQRERLRRLIPRTAHWMLDLAKATSDSGLESLLRVRLHLVGLRLRAQVHLSGVGTVDFLVGRLVIEADGRENHESLAKRHKDLVRDAAAARLGYETLRFDYAQIVYDWPSVQAAILAALGRRAA